MVGEYRGDVAVVTIDQGALERVMGPQITDWLQRTKLTPIASTAFANCPQGERPDGLGREPKDPAMRYQINTRIEGSGLTQVGVVVCNSPHAVFVNRGTAPHLIEAWNVSRLRFLQNGTVRFPRAVNHPGTQANPFMFNAMVTVMS